MVGGNINYGPPAVDTGNLDENSPGINVINQHLNPPGEVSQQDYNAAVPDLSKDDDYNLPSPDFGYFGSQDAVQPNNFDLDSLISDNNVDSTTGYVSLLQELTECVNNL